MVEERSRNPADEERNKTQDDDFDSIWSSL
jgi:hypothetical protein